MAFIDEKLPDEKVTNFVRHIKNCPCCFEELEIHYTLIVGMRQLDNNKELSLDFKKDLETELNKIDNKVKNVKRFKISTFSIVFVSIVVFLLFIYGKVLDRVYTIEQNMLKESQGKYYFYDNFQEYIYTEEEDLVKYVTRVEKPKEKTFYEKIHSYNITHIDYSDE